MVRPAARAYGFGLILMLGPFSPVATMRVWASDLIAPGIQAKAAAGAGQTVSRGATALFYNPANLILTKQVEPSLDVAVAKVTYTYAHAQSDTYPRPVVVSAAAPPITAGASFGLAPHIALGFALVPTGGGATRIAKDVPLFIPGVNAYPKKNRLVDVFASESGVSLTGGAALRLAQGLTLGGGVIYHQTDYKKYQVANSNEQPFLDLKVHGSTTQWIGGIRSDMVHRHVTLGLSLKTAAQARYKGDYRLDLTGGQGRAKVSPAERTDFLPMTLGLGVETRFAIFSAFFDYTREYSSAGRSIARFGLENDPLEVDLVDTHNICVGVKISPRETHLFTIALGRYGANIGQGSEISGTQPPTLRLLQDNQETPIASTVGGMSFGNLQGIARTILAAGYHYSIGDRGSLDLATQYQTGVRHIPSGFSQEGTHRLTVVLAAVGLSYGI